MLISGMGQTLMIQALGKKLSTSSVSIWDLWLTFVLVWISKTQNQAVMISLFLITQRRFLQKPLITPLMLDVFFIFVSKCFVSLLVLSLIIFPTIFWFILASIHLHTELFLPHLTYFLWNLKVHLHDILIRVELEIKHRANKYLTHQKNVTDLHLLNISYTPSIFQH